MAPEELNRIRQEHRNRVAQWKAYYPDDAIVYEQAARLMRDERASATVTEAGEVIHLTGCEF